MATLIPTSNVCKYTNSRVATRAALGAQMATIISSSVPTAHEARTSTANMDILCTPATTPSSDVYKYYPVTSNAVDVQQSSIISTMKCYLVTSSAVDVLTSFPVFINQVDNRAIQIFRNRQRQSCATTVSSASDPSSPSFMSKLQGSPSSLKFKLKLKCPCQIGLYVSTFKQRAWCNKFCFSSFGPRPHPNKGSFPAAVFLRHDPNADNTNIDNVF